jgi:hypothetical protein
MKCAVEIGSDEMIYMPGFIKIGSAVYKLIREGTQNILLHYTTVHM